ncbi:MAG: hypothetical protein KC910_14825 [Candidatus Eremiobacteraeota bacterium]|nr:hypothetical protein [Candidatus Eremiobacteraeota bacterium]
MILLDDEQAWWRSWLAGLDSQPDKIVLVCSKPSGFDDVLAITPKTFQGPGFAAWLERFEAADASRAQQLLAHVSHEMRSPLSVISMACQLSKKPSLAPEKRQRYIHLIEDSSSIIQTLINDILDFAKLARGDITLLEQVFDLHALLEDTVQASRLLATSKKLGIQLELAALVPRYVRADPGRLRQVLTNLISNAIKFTEQGRVRVVAKLAPPRIAFEIRDTGIGIAEGSLEKIFQPYEQADGTILGRFGGTGLGLAISRRLVSIMGGDIGVKSRLGQGSVFWFTANLPVGDFAPLPKGTTDLSGCQILLMSQHLELGEIDLGKEGPQVTVHSGDELPDQSFDILAYDLEWGGFRRLSEVLRHTEGLFRKVLAFTLAGQRGDADACKLLDVDAYLSEGFQAEDVIDSLEVLLSPGYRGGLLTRFTLKTLRAART